MIDGSLLTLVLQIEWLSISESESRSRIRI